MAFQLDATAIAHVSMNPAVRDAAAVGAGLIELWPLTDAKQMDNDTKYGENLQVRMTLHGRAGHDRRRRDGPRCGVRV